MVDSLLKRDRQPLDHNLGFHSRPTQTSFESRLPSSKSNHFKLQWPMDFDLGVKGGEAELLVSCNTNRGN